MTTFRIIRTIPLTRGKYAIVDHADYEMLSRWKWQAVKAPCTWYARRSERTAGCTYMHRQLMPLAETVDHISGDGLDNRRGNLRPATQAQQCRNSRPKGGLSKYKGVALDRRDGVWYAHITVNRVRMHLGRYDSEVRAARAYDAAARLHHGEFARLNFPEEVAS